MSIFSKWIVKERIKDVKNVTSNNSNAINTILDNQLRIITTQLSLIDILEKKGVMTENEFNYTMNNISSSEPVKNIKVLYEELKINCEDIDDELLNLMEELDNVTDGSYTSF